MRSETPEVGSTWTEPITGMEFVWIPPGRFMMGQTEADKALIVKERGEKAYNESYKDELPRHEVVIQRGFYIGKYPVMQEQWQQIMDKNPSRFNEEKVGKEWRRHPVENVSWDDCQEFLRKLNATVRATGRSPVPYQYRLPSEAEWEYVCRAGSEGLFCFGDDVALLDEYAWYDKNSEDRTHPVGKKKPNDFGLYDMHGNVYEWCADTYHDNYENAPNDGNIWGYLDDKKAKVLRGGSWNLNPVRLRSATRLIINPDVRFYDQGFRVVVGVGRDL